MKFSNIKVKHVYNVIFDDVRECEFDGIHLALVLKLNNDKKTVIVMPLTSVSTGVGFNKVKLDKIDSLPSNLKTNESYAVYNQIRTVNANRFIALKDEDRKPIDVPIEDEVFSQLMILGIKDLMFNGTFDENISIIDGIKEQLLTEKAIGIAYDIRDNKGDIKYLEQQLKLIADGLDFNYTVLHTQHRIDKIINDVIEKSGI